MLPAAVLTQGVPNMMRRQFRVCAVMLACGCLALAGWATADDQKNAKDSPVLTGSWSLKGGEPKISFPEKGVMKIAPHGDEEVILLNFTYTVEKDGRIAAKLTALEGKEEIKEKAKGSLPVGLMFSFKWTIKDSTAMLDDVKGENAERLKAHLEGEYEKQ